MSNQKPKKKKKIKPTQTSEWPCTPYHNRNFATLLEQCHDTQQAGQSINYAHYGT